MVLSNDVVHYYMGSLFRFTYNNGDIIESVLENVNDTGFICGENTFERVVKDDWFEIDNYRKDGKLQLILTHPCDMTAHEKQAYKKLCKVIKDSDGITQKLVDTPASLHYLFSHSVDAFELIETGQAINKNTGVVVIPADEIPDLTEIEAAEKERNKKPYEFIKDFRD